jgi:hypothetical protein
VLAGACGAGDLVGQVRFDGPVEPLPPPPRDARAEVCGRVPTRSPALVTDAAGGLANVVVALQGVESPTAESPGPALLDQRFCTFQPHVLLLRRGQALRLRNSDPVLHNVRATTMRGRYQRFNVGLPPAGAERSVTESRLGALELRCDAGHPWMRGYVFVVRSHLAALTDEAGRFRIVGVPPGEHRVTVWHELLGRRVLTVQVPAEGSARLDVRADLDAEPGLTWRAGSSS